MGRANRVTPGLEIESHATVPSQDSQRRRDYKGSASGTRNVKTLEFGLLPMAIG